MPIGSSRAVVWSIGVPERVFATQSVADGLYTGLASLRITRNGYRTSPGTNCDAPAVMPTIGPGRFRIASSDPSPDVPEPPQPAERAAVARRTAKSRPTGRV